MRGVVVHHFASLATYVSHIWPQILPLITGNKTTWCLIKRLVLAVAVYFIWQERNNRMFNNKRRNSHVLCDMIQKEVRMKLMGLHFKPSQQGVDLVMVDGSHLPFKENISYTKCISSLAHAKGMVVEAELGRLSGTEDDLTVQDYEEKLTDVNQEENRILDKMNRQKVSEVEKLTQTVCELEEAVLAAGAAANAVRDYERKMQEINEEKKLLDRELARAKISANRVAVVVANEWKDADNKVMPVKQWLEERRVLQVPRLGSSNEVSSNDADERVDKS